MEKFFKLKENNTTVSTEITAGITTFFAMAYIIAVNPSVLSATGMEWGAVFLATIIAAIIGTLVMGLFANVPYAQAPGMGLNAFFTYTVCFGLGFTWQQAMSMVFICGLLNILITVTKVRKMIIKAIPKSLQLAISGGIGAFIAYLGFLNVGMIQFSPDETQPALAVPGIASFNTPVLWVFLIGLVLAIEAPCKLTSPVSFTYHQAGLQVFHIGIYLHAFQIDSQARGQSPFRGNPACQMKRQCPAKARFPGINLTDFGRQGYRARSPDIVSGKNLFLPMFAKLLCRSR